jgi:CotS family spore coat protein
MKQVEHDFGFKIKQWKIIRDVKKSSYVARIVTDKGIKKALKSLYISPDRQRFITNSEVLLAEQGIELARPTPTLKGKPFMIYNEVPYVLYDWIRGKFKSLGSQDHLEAMIQVMARFHHASRNLKYPSNTTIYSHPDWEKEYRQRIRNMKNWFKDTQARKHEKYKIIHKEIPFFQKIAQKALDALKDSRYQDYRRGLLSEQMLVHGDFHQKNLIFQKDKGVIIDFEDVRYDLPSKDLIRLFSMYLKRHSFNESTFHSMMKTYERIHPLSPDLKRLVMIDFLFPHIVERMLRKKKYRKLTVEQIKQWIKHEKKKAIYVHRAYFKNQQNEKEGESQ